VQGDGGDDAFFSYLVFLFLVVRDSGVSGLLLFVGVVVKTWLQYPFCSDQVFRRCSLRSIIHSTDSRNLSHTISLLAGKP
jgi:hypothetical protein